MKYINPIISPKVNVITFNLLILAPSGLKYGILGIVNKSCCPIVLKFFFHLFFLQLIVPSKVKYICNNIFKYFSLKNLNNKNNPKKTELPIIGNNHVSFCFILSIPSFCLSPEIKHIFVENVIQYKLESK